MIATVLDEHTSGTPLYTPSSWYTPGKFWYTLGCTIHPVDKHRTKAIEKCLIEKNIRVFEDRLKNTLN